MKNCRRKHKKSTWSKIFFPITGLIALIWFMIRVLPKPSRAAYPCMKATIPAASAFVIWISGIAASSVIFKSARKFFHKSRYMAALSAVVVALLLFGVAILVPQKQTIADSVVEPNNPMGDGKGVYPGRVVWAWNPDATNEKCTNSASKKDAYYLPENCDLDVIDTMIDESILTLTGKTTLQEAWDAMFKNFNNDRGRGEIGYQDGEKIFIKMNLVGSDANSTWNLSSDNGYRMARTSPQPVLVILRHLINECGIPQDMISLGDPMKDLAKDYFDVWYSEFPDVNYMSKKGGAGRTATKSSTNKVMFYSDRGDVLRTGGSGWSDASDGSPVEDDRLYKCLVEADYMINVPALKAHHRAGMTLIAKNHFGSHTRSAAKHLHMGLVNPDGQPVATPKRAGYKQYRIQVDLLGHEKLGGNTMLVVVDGLWGGPDANDAPTKFKMAPFNRDWPSSIFVSQDQIAIASVCLDFLREEFRDGRHSKTYPQMYGVDDYLRQAADPAQWPDDVEYDPENDGTLLTSLGTHEHWNNAEDMLYSRNMGKDEGIELVRIQKAAAVKDNVQSVANNFRLLQNYPNPFNPSTTIRYELTEHASLTLNIYNAAGQKIKTLFNGEQSAGMHSVIWNGNTDDGTAASSGVYFYQISGTSGSEQFQQTQKMILAK